MFVLYCSSSCNLFIKLGLFLDFSHTFGGFSDVITNLDQSADAMMLFYSIFTKASLQDVSV